MNIQLDFLKMKPREINQEHFKNHGFRPNGFYLKQKNFPNLLTCF